MRLLFIYPNDYLFAGIPNGIATLSAVLRKEGHDVSLFDFTFLKTREIELRPNKGAYLPTAFTLEDLVKDDPMTTLEEAFYSKLKEFKPELIAVSTMTGYFDEVINLLESAELSCPVIVGGVHATIFPEDVLYFDVVDFICIGEGEDTILELCDCLKHDKDYSEIKNLGYKRKGQFFINEPRPFVNLDSLPMPDWSIFDERHLFRPFLGNIYQGSFYVMSRGCPQLCTYCVNASLRETLKSCGRYFRYQSPTTTIKQIKYLKETFNATWFKFADDSIMLFSDQYLEELADGLEPLKIMFGCSVRPETTTPNKVRLLKRMGCVAATVGVELGNEKMRKSILNRRMTNEQIENAIVILKEVGIRVSTFNMIGLPGETRENVFETIKLNKKLGVEAVNVYIIYPYPGTDIFKKYKIKLRDESGKIIPVSKASSFALSQMPPSEVEGILKTFGLYHKLPEEMWNIIKIAEEDNKTANKLLFALDEYLMTLNIK